MFIPPVLGSNVVNLILYRTSDEMTQVGLRSILLDAWNRLLTD